MSLSIIFISPYKLLFISCSTCFGPPCAHLQELATQWYFFTCGVVPGCVDSQVRLDGCVSIGKYVAEKIPLSRQLLKMGTRCPETF